MKCWERGGESCLFKERLEKARRGPCTCCGSRQLQAREFQAGMWLIPVPSVHVQSWGMLGGIFELLLGIVGSQPRGWSWRGIHRQTCGAAPGPGHSEPWPWTFQGSRGSHSSPGNPSPGPPREQFLPYIPSIPALWQWEAIPPIPSLHALVNSPGDPELSSHHSTAAPQSCLPSTAPKASIPSLAGRKGQRCLLGHCR